MVPADVKGILPVVDDGYLSRAVCTATSTGLGRVGCGHGESRVTIREHATFSGVHFKVRHATETLTTLSERGNTMEGENRLHFDGAERVCQGAVHPRRGD